MAETSGQFKNIKITLNLSWLLATVIPSLTLSTWLIHDKLTEYKTDYAVLNTNYKNLKEKLETQEILVNKLREAQIVVAQNLNLMNTMQHLGLVPTPTADRRISSPNGIDPNSKTGPFPEDNQETIPSRGVASMPNQSPTIKK